MSAVVDAVVGVVEFVGDVVHKAADLVVDTVKAVIADPLPTLLAIAGNMVGIPVPITSAAITAARGGSLEDIAKSAAIAYVAQEAAPVIAGSISPTVASSISNTAVANAVTNAITSGLVNGTISAAQGGDFAQGFTGGFVGSAVGAGAKEIIGPTVMAQAKELGFQESTGKAIVSALSSSTGAGAAAAATGGDFNAAFERGLATAGVNFAATKASDALKDTLKKQTASNDETLKAKYAESVKINQQIQENALAQQKALDESNARAMAVNEKQAALQNELDAFNNDPNRTPEQRAALQAKIDAFTVEHKDAMDFYEQQKNQVATLKAQQDDLVKQYDQTISGTDQAAADFFIQEEKNAEKIKQAYDLNEEYKTLTGEEITPEKLAELQKSDNLKEAAAKDLGFDSVESMQTALTMKTLDPEVAPKLEAREGETAGQLVKETLEDGSVVYSRTFTGKTPDGKEYAYKATYDEKNPRGVEYEVLSGVSQDYASGTPVEVISGTERPNFGNPQPPENLDGTGVKKTPVDLQKDAADAHNNYVNASVLASITPTPENVAAANQAKLDAELAQKMADDASIPTDTNGTQVADSSGVGTLNPDLGEVPVKPNQTFPTSNTVGVNDVVNPNDGWIDTLGGVAKDVIAGGLTGAISGGNTSGGTTTVGTTSVPKVAAGLPAATTAATTTSGLTSSTRSTPSVFFEAPNIMMTPQQIAERENFILGRQVKRGGLVSKRKK